MMKTTTIEKQGAKYMFSSLLKNVIYELKNNMYTPMLEVTAGGGGHVPLRPLPPLNPPLGV